MNSSARYASWSNSERPRCRQRAALRQGILPGAWLPQPDGPLTDATAFAKRWRWPGDATRQVDFCAQRVVAQMRRRSQSEAKPLTEAPRRGRQPRRDGARCWCWRAARICLPRVPTDPGAQSYVMAFRSDRTSKPQWCLRRFFIDDGSTAVDRDVGIGKHGTEHAMRHDA